MLALDVLLFLHRRLRLNQKQKNPKKEKAAYRGFFILKKNGFDKIEGFEQKMEMLLLNLVFNNTQ